MPTYVAVQWCDIQTGDIVFEDWIERSKFKEMLGIKPGRLNVQVHMDILPRRRVKTMALATIECKLGP